MADEAPVASSGETLIEHPEVPGAVQRVPSDTFDPGRHRLWPEGQLPWMDGSGNPIPGRSGPAAKSKAVPPRKSAKVEPPSPVGDQEQG